jgi:metallo-beta-lactamase class B
LKPAPFIQITDSQQIAVVNDQSSTSVRRRRQPAKTGAIHFGAACLLAAGIGSAGVGTAFAAPSYAPADDPVNIHLANAQKAAGLDFPGLLARVCIVPPGGGDAAMGKARAGGVNGLSETMKKVDMSAEVVPPKFDWYQEPRQIFDNLYWVGIKRNSAWVIKTSQGLIVIDTLYHYAVEPAIVDGIRKLGMDPKDIKYVVISHGHLDHDQGAKILQDLGARVLLSAPDWDLMLNGPAMPGGNPKRDMVVTDGQSLTLGDTTVHMYITPGHTDGTVSMIFTVRDHGKPLTIAYPGGTAYNFPRSPERFQKYVDTQRRFAKLAADAGATVILSNHSEFDEAYQKARMIATMQPGENNPFIFKDSVKRYFDTLTECAEAEKARLEEGFDTPSMQ